MEGIIAHDFQLETLKPSSAESGGDQGELWYEDGSSSDELGESLDRASDMDREWQRRRNQFHTMGYRDGLMAGKEASAQEGFNAGFKSSVYAGYNWGLVRGIISVMAALPDGIKDKLCETDEKRRKLQNLHESVYSLSTTDALKLFHEDHMRISAKEKEDVKSSSTLEDIHHQDSDINTLKKYHAELKSLFSGSPVIEVDLKPS